MDKKKIKETVHGVADKAADACNEKAKAATGWKRWLWGIGAIIAAAVAWFTQGCESVTPAQVHAAHALFHAVTGEAPCLGGPSRRIAEKPEASRPEGGRGAGCMIAHPEPVVVPCKK